MSAVVFWCCHGVSMLLAHPISEDVVNNAIVKHREKVGVKQDDYGMIVQITVVEMRSLGVGTSVQIVPGHVIQHSCKRLYTPDEWVALPALPHNVQSTNGKNIVVATRLCKCGKHVGYPEMKVTHVEHTCNARGGSA